MANQLGQAALQSTATISCTPNVTVILSDKIISVMMVRIPVAYYKENENSTPVEHVLRFCDGGFRMYTHGGEQYYGLGGLMGITSSSSDLRATSGEVSVTISGIPNTSLYEIINSRIKGCPIQIFRSYFDGETYEPLTLRNGVNTTARFYGFINNYAIQEEYDVDRRTSSNTIVFSCTSSIDFLQNKTSGRKTNPSSEKKFFPNDKSMDRVPTLENTAFDFGKVPVTTTTA